jgi:hypothetical protein
MHSFTLQHCKFFRDEWSKGSGPYLVSRVLTAWLSELARNCIYI